VEEAAAREALRLAVEEEVRLHPLAVAVVAAVMPLMLVVAPALEQAEQEATVLVVLAAAQERTVLEIQVVEEGRRVRIQLVVLAAQGPTLTERMA
jgi:hypothetical protein